MSPEDVTACFTRSDGSYAFARWGRPVAPVVFGVDDATLAVVRDAIRSVVAMAGHDMQEIDAELGANLMLFFVRDWDELTGVPGLDQLVTDLGPLVGRLAATGANQYRVFRFDREGAIKAAFVFLRMDADLSAVPADTLALAQAVQTIVLWSDLAFRDRSPLVALPDGRTGVRPEIGALLRAAHEPVMPVAANDPSHALRLAARVGRAG